MHEYEPTDPADSALRDWVASVANYIDDSAKKATLRAFLADERPVEEWSRPELDTLIDTCGYVISVARMNRALHNLSSGAP